MIGPRVAAFAAPLGVCLLFAVLVGLGVFDPLELQGYDLLVFSAGYPAPHDSVAIVDFDNASIAAIGKYPVPRDILARVLRRIVEAEPAVIGLDKLLADPATPEADQDLAAAIARAGNIVLANTFGTPQIPASEPLPAFRSASSVGFVNLVADSDGFVRRMLTFIKTPEFSGVSFPVAVASRFLGQELQPAEKGALRLGDVAIPLDATGLNAAILGAWNPRPARWIVPVRELLSGAFDASVLRGKIVIVGESSTAGKDLYATPVFRFRSKGAARAQLSGSEIHAVAIDSLLTGRIIRVLPPLVRWPVSIVVVALACLLLLLPRPLYGVPAAAILAVAVFFTALFLFSRQQIWMPYVGVEGGIVLSLVAGLGFRFRQERRLKSLAQAETQRESNERRKLEEEMVSAREIQRSLLPAELPRVEGLDIAARYQPASLVGGDYYDFFRPDPSQLFLVIADVQGHGASAALVMANFQATLHNLFRAPHRLSLPEIAAQLNQALIESTGGRRLVTLFLGRLNLTTRELTYVNAGHVPPFLVRPDENPPLQLHEGGLLLGAFPDSQYDSGCVQLIPGDVLVAQTDGIADTRDSSGQRFTFERVMQTAAQHGKGSAAEIVETVFRETVDSGHAGEEDDDKLLLVIKIS